MSLLKAGRPTRRERAISAVQDRNSKVRVNFDVSKAFHKKIKQRALDENISVKEYILKALNEYLSK